VPLAPHRPAALLCALLIGIPTLSFGQSPAPAAARIVPRFSAEEQALLAIRNDAIRRVQVLMDRMEGMPDGPARDELERQIVAIKQESEIEFLEAKVRFARARGDELTAFEAERQLQGATPSAVAGDVCADSLDANQTCAAATVIIPRNYPLLQLGVTPGDDDWYKVNVQRNGTLSVTLSFSHAGGNIDLRLYDVCGGTLLQSSTTLTNTEQITYKNTSPTRFLYLRVSMSTGTCNTYGMNVAITTTTNTIATVTPAGWASPVVPRNVNNSTNGSVPLSATLPGNGSTYGNWVTQITGDNTPSFHGAVFLDDSLMQATNYNDNTGAGLWIALNAGPYTIRGGRHTLRHESDAYDEMIESNENDNSWANQWVWSPLVTTFHTPNVRDFPPLKGTGVYKNADGFSFTRQPTFSWVVAMAPLMAGDDYDLNVYSNYAGSTSGFTTLLETSAASNNNIDFVVGHYNGSPTTVYPAVDRFLANHGGDYVIDQSDARLANGNLSTTPAFSWTPITLPANRLADVYECYMISGTTYYFTLRTLSGITPMQFQIFPPTNGLTWFPGQGTASNTFTTPQTLSYNAFNTGWHPIVVYRRSGTNADTELVYDFEWSTTTLVDVPESNPAGRLTLSGAIPNPVRDRGSIHYVLPSAGEVALGIYDVNGRMVRDLVSGTQPAGAHSIEWDGSRTGGGRLAAGVYWARLRFGGQALTRRIALVR